MFLSFEILVTGLSQKNVSLFNDHNYKDWKSLLIVY